MIGKKHPAGPEWIESLLEVLGIAGGAAPEVALERAEVVANRLAPDTRRIWKWVLIAQGAAVVAPLSWLIVVRQQWPTSYTAYFVTVCTLAIITICWWLRWKGMQHTWARARVIAEIARSMKASQVVDAQLTTEALSTAPDLQRISRGIGGRAPFSGQTSEADVDVHLNEAKRFYLRERIEDQLAYYEKKRAEAEDSRVRLNRAITLSLDTALFLAIAGVVISLNPTGLNWLIWSGSDYVLGALGVVLPLTAVLFQLLGSYLELNRRIGRYAQQIQILKPARERVAEARSTDELGRVILDVERSLLGEVIDWYYQTEHQQLYYRGSGKPSTSADVEKVAAAIQPAKREWLPHWARRGAGFMFKVVIGRVLVGAISIVLTTAFIAFRQKPDSLDIQSVLRREDGRLLSWPEQKGTAEAWVPDPQRARNGFVLLAHGLHDGVDAKGRSTDELHWMTRLQRELITALGDAAPDICLVDWENAAKPYLAPVTAAEREIAGLLSAFALPQSANNFLLDVATIRPQGQAIGELVGYKLARAIRQGKLDPDKPMHLIGHSAGGFVVLNAAIVLDELGLASEQLHVTLLDTPMPIRAHLEQAAHSYKVDYYCTSSFALMVPDSNLHENYTRIDVQPPAGTDPYLAAHSYAYIWFTDSIRTGLSEGFARSPFSRLLPGLNPEPLP